MMSQHREEKKTTERKSILRTLLSRPEPDKTYNSDLKEQWADLDKKNRIKFVIGAVTGLILFIGALVLSWLVLASLLG
jgi:hypothetical protein